MNQRAAENSTAASRTHFLKLYNAAVDRSLFNSLRLLLLIAVVGAGLVVVASRTDVPVSNWVHERGIGTALKGRNALLFVLKAPGNYFFTLCVAALIGLMSARRWVGAALVAVSGIVSGLAYVLVKWCVGRTRPFKGVPPFEFHPFQNGWHGLKKAENQAFPSGHACLAFATAEALAMLLPRWRVAFYAGALVVGVERVMEGAHYPADAVAGAVFGILSARITGLFIERVTRTRRSHLAFPSSTPGVPEQGSS